MSMARPKRYQPFNPKKVHDRRSSDLLRNAEVAAIEVDCPIEQNGATLVVMRSIRNDPLAALHSRRQIDEAQYQGGRAFQHDFENAGRGPRAIDPGKEFVDGGLPPDPLPDSQSRAVESLKRAHKELGQAGSALIHDVLIGSMTLDRVAGKRQMNTELEKKYLGRRFRECLDTLAIVYGFATENSGRS